MAGVPADPFLAAKTFETFRERLIDPRYPDTPRSSGIAEDERRGQHNSGMLPVLLAGDELPFLCPKPGLVNLSKELR
jgi:hypothetical protein